MSIRSRQLGFLTACVFLLCSVTPIGQTVAVRFPEGLVHGFLSLKTLGGAFLADGDLIQNVAGDRVTTRLVFHFKDGSLSDETAIYSQRQHFQLISDHMIQKGPAFPMPLDMMIDGASGRVTVHYTDDGKEKVESEHFDLPSDLANGIIPTLLKNVRAEAVPKTLSFVVATPKPRVVKLAISVAGTDAFSTASAAHSATHYVLKVEIGGITGFFAGLLGKVPPDSHVWILGGEAPAFIRSDLPFFLGAPLWRIELVSPVWR